MRVAAIVPAAGVGRRLEAGKSKALVRIGREPLFLHTLSRLRRCCAFSEIIIAAPADRLQEMARLIKRRGLAGKVRVVAGGKTRAESVRNAFFKMKPSSEWALVHDAARPLVSPALCRRLLAAAAETGAAIPVEPVTATVKRSDAQGKNIQSTVARGRLFLAQTPQVFRKDFLREAYRRWGKRALGVTDEAKLFEGSPVRVRLVAGDRRNLKITTPEDIDLYEFYARRNRV